jgi:hypothetical protein
MKRGLHSYLRANIQLYVIKYALNHFIILRLNLISIYSRGAFWLQRHFYGIITDPGGLTTSFILLDEADDESSIRGPPCRISTQSNLNRTKSAFSPINNKL